MIYSLRDLLSGLLQVASLYLL